MESAMGLDPLLEVRTSIIREPNQSHNLSTCPGLWDYEVHGPGAEISPVAILVTRVGHGHWTLTTIGVRHPWSQWVLVKLATPLWSQSEWNPNRIPENPVVIFDQGKIPHRPIGLWGIMTSYAKHQYVALRPA